MIQKEFKDKLTLTLDAQIDHGKEYVPEPKKNQVKKVEVVHKDILLAYNGKYLRSQDGKLEPMHIMLRLAGREFKSDGSTSSNNLLPNVTIDGIHSSDKT